jgi:glycosyltransferase involved in cell wall biosynthesis
VFFWSASEVDGTWEYRCRMPMEELNRLGHQAQGGCQMSAWGREADIIVGQRICQTRPSIGWQLLCQQRAASGRGGMVYEVDDDLFNIHHETNPLGRAFQHPVVQENMRDNIRAADAVTVTTEPLAVLLRKVRRDADPATVHVVPNAVRVEALTTVRRRPPTRYTLYGWQGSDTHAADWAVARDAVAVVLREDRLRARLRFLGTHHVAGLPPLGEGSRIDFTPWTTDIAEHYRRVADFDVSLAPLANTKFNRSKSALRALESLALGVPVVASDVPSYRGWVADGVTGLLVRPSTAAWVEALRRMQDPARRGDMAAAGREAARAWSIDRAIGAWLDVYRSLIP